MTPLAIDILAIASMNFWLVFSSNRKQIWVRALLLPFEVVLAPDSSTRRFPELLGHTASIRSTTGKSRLSAIIMVSPSACSRPLVVAFKIAVAGGIAVSYKKLGKVTQQPRKNCSSLRGTMTRSPAKRLHSGLGQLSILFTAKYLGSSWLLQHYSWAADYCKPTKVQDTL